MQRLEDWARRAKAAGADLAVFGELYLTGYRSDNFMHRHLIAPSDEDPWVRRLVAVARALDIWLLTGAASSGGVVPGDMYNSAFLIGPAGLAGTYSKTHLGSFPVSDEVTANEGSFYSPGRAIEVLPAPFATLGVQICYDVHFPEVSRVLALKGAEVIINLSAALAGFESFWDALLPVRAEENRIWYVMSSVVGAQRDSEFFGGSRVLDPLGRVLACARHGSEDLVLADLAGDTLMQARTSSHRFSTRRPELYTAISEPTPYP